MIAYWKLGLPEVVDWLIHHGAEVEKQDLQQCTPLALAVFSGELDCAKILVESGKANLNTSTSDGMAPLHWVSALL